MFNSFSSALSAMKAHATAVDVVGNNLANVNTTGFKASDVAFKDLVSESLSARNEIGMGVSKPLTVRTFTQGAIQSSANKLDAAIQGNGFFVVKNGDAALYTRDGGFEVDREGYVRTRTGEKVQQFKNGVLSEIRIPSGASAATPTKNISISANLNAGALVGDSFAAPVEVVDAQGSRHTVSVTYTKAADNQWTYSISIPITDFATPPATPAPLATGTIDFNTDGTFKSLAQTTPTAVPAPAPVAGVTAPPPKVDFAITGLKNGVSDLALSWNLGDSTNIPTLTQFAQPSSISRTTQDGFASSELVDVGLVDGGTVMARYSNGQQQAVALLAIALVPNPDTLTAAGNNLFRTTIETSQPLAGTANLGGRGGIKAQALEASTVDIAREFTNLIVYQRGYQASSRVITTADEMSQETLNLKR